MRHLRKLFYIPKYKKGTDNHLRQVLLTSICGVLLCMCCLVGTSWAWFQTSIVSEGNVITIGSFEATVSLVKGETASRSAILPTDVYTYELDDVGTYNIFIVNTGSIPGYCTIKLTDDNGESETFTSGTLYPADDNEETLDSVTITITITAEDVYNDVLPIKLKITPHWGEDPNYAVANIAEALFINEDADDETDGEDSDSTVDLPDNEDTQQSPSAGENESTEATESTDETQGTDETGGAGENEGADETGGAGENEGTDETEGADETESTDETQNTETTEVTGETQNTDAAQPKETEPAETTTPAETEPAAQADTETETQSQSETEPDEQETAAPEATDNIT